MLFQILAMNKHVWTLAQKIKNAEILSKNQYVTRQKCCLLLPMETGWEETEDSVNTNEEKKSIWLQNYPQQ